MKKIIVIVLIGLITIACGKDSENTMIVQGTIKDLKKGTLYLQKQNDSLMVTVDSVALDGTDTYILKAEVESPEMYYLSLDKSPSKEIAFFGEKGTITINTKLDKFQFAAKINGLTNQQLLDEYNKIKSKYTGKRLDLVKADFEAKRDNDTIRIDSIANAIDQLLKSRYRYAINFAITNRDKEVAPFVALTEFNDANLVWIDSVNNSLTPEIKESKYGKILNEFVAERKKSN
ncbi:DUF4369 domain-containing protein [Aureibaculum sp. 2210JD6-5]|uniref:DUF4369 domain-containing protein n=1 Tax=Aureibaculum sp. 2210JD6-5 TaxID=3103957 RepID=UPI002AAE8A8E|nr:DUF4369 domain-containing protein [Aureibaculum sp. 2210JD6-5]MDY7393775.1 DUF4369 domain-containing protein [Aureibaculum sp. 2210JD6-5]